MCGIVAVVGKTTEKNPSSLSEIILEGLKKLEYRGYDSAGIAFLNNKKFTIVKEEGKIAKLESTLKKHKFPASAAIGHTRWATHGKPSRENAHPHSSSSVCVVHNGIIENYQQLKKALLESKVKFLSKTDSEVIPHLLEEELKVSNNPKSAILKTVTKLHGTFAIAAIFREFDNLLVLAKRGSPLVIGIGENQNFAASDFLGIASQTNRFIALEDNEIALISKEEIEIFDFYGKKIERESKVVNAKAELVDKSGFAHFMLKEIYEQPRVIEDTLQRYVSMSEGKINLPALPFDLTKFNKLTIVACGTSYYAGLVAKYIIENFAKIEVEVDIASEFRYRDHPFRSDNLMIFISQSGETADSIASLKFAKQNHQKTLAVVNVEQCNMASIADAALTTTAGIEVGVASTKAYTAQVLLMSLFGLQLGFLRKNVSAEKLRDELSNIASCRLKMQKIFDEDKIRNIKKIAYKLSKKNSILYTGRSVSSITALEAALKFRELTYINASGIAAGELKHGTIALIDKKMLVIVIAPNNKAHNLFEKTVSNAEEINARGGKIIFVSDKNGISYFGKMARNKIELPETENLIDEALLTVVPMQLLAYFATVFKGFDVDQPRNLAKSVTVE